MNEVWSMPSRNHARLGATLEELAMEVWESEASRARRRMSSHAAPPRIPNPVPW